MTTLATTKKKTSVPSLFQDFFNEGFFDTPPFFSFENQTGSFIPNVNVIENKDNFEIELAAPGLESKDFKAEINNGVLNISAEKEQEFKEEIKNFRKREFCFTSFSRSFVLPENIATDKIDATYKNGVLRIMLPKKNSSVKTPVKKIKIG